MGTLKDLGRRAPKLDDVLVPEQIAEIVDFADGPLLIGIDGPGGSGKSSLARQLAGCLRYPVEVIENDDFYRPSDDPARSETAVAGQFDILRLQQQVVARHCAGEDVHYQRYDWDNDTMGDWVTVPAGYTVIVEGVYCTHPLIRESYDLRIWVNASRETRLARGVARDGEESRAMWEDVWMPAEDRYVRECESPAHAHLVLDGSGDFKDAEQLRYSVTGGSLTLDA